MLPIGLSAQTIPQKDSLANVPLRQVPDILQDSTTFVSQPIRPVSRQDSLKSTIKYSEDALEDPVDYEARDSQWLDAKNREVHLYGAAKVTYDKLVLTADYIVLNLDENIATAEGPIVSDGWQARPNLMMAPKSLVPNDCVTILKVAKALFMMVRPNRMICSCSARKPSTLPKMKN